MKPLASFKIRPAGSLYYQVNVWPTKAAMHKHCFWMPGKDYEAACSTYKSSHYPRCCGEVNLHRRACRPGIIVHELTHAAIGWAERKKLNLSRKHVAGTLPRDCDEEQFCHAMGALTAQCFSAMWEYRIWK